MAVGAAVAVAGTAMAVSSKIKAAADGKRAAQAEANSRRAQANEIIARSEINIKEIRKEAELFKAKQAVAFAASGVDVGSGAPLVAMENTNRVVATNIDNRRRESGYQAEAALRGAQINDKQARDIKRAGTNEAIGTGLRGLSLIAGRA